MADHQESSRPSKPSTAVIDHGALVSQIQRIQGRRALLVFLSGNNIGGIIPLGDREVVLGRESDCDIILTDDGVSRRHARVRMIDDGSFEVQDMGSTNGTTVNGVRVSNQPLHDGDRVALGRVVVKFVLQAQVDEEYQRRIYEVSIRDPLTGRYNRRHFDERLGSEVAYARRHASLVSLILFDIDHFKRLNDTYGHLAGDRVLVDVSAQVQNQVRSEDVLARYGGEEFVVLVRETPPAGVATLADRIRAGVEQMRVAFNELTLSVTVSVGAATVRGHPGLTPEQLVEAADRVMYRAKAAGRNRVFAETTGV